MTSITLNRLVRAVATMAALVLAVQPSQLGATAAPATRRGDTYSYEEIVSAGHRFFGKTAKGLASVVEYAFQRAGEPNGYIVGEEGSGAFVGGSALRRGHAVSEERSPGKGLLAGPVDRLRFRR